MGGILVGAVSAEPLFVPVIGYLAVVLIARLLQHHIWQSPIIALFITIFIGTLVTNLISLVVLQFSDVPLPWFDSLNLVILPSALLNLILSLPVYVFYERPC
jgi:biotin transporter BioY